MADWQGLSNLQDRPVIAVIVAVVGSEYGVCSIFPVVRFPTTFHFSRIFKQSSSGMNLRGLFHPKCHKNVQWIVILAIGILSWLVFRINSSAAKTPDTIFQVVTYYIRTDGGSPEQCNGRVDAPYPGSGVNQPCAWDHPFRALPPPGPGGVLPSPRIAGGDTLIIASGSYKMGSGAPGTEDCDDGLGSYECLMQPILSGPDPEHPTRILGAGWDAGCANPPELWGTGRPWYILNLTDSSNVEVGCLEITDHSSCVEFHDCERDALPYGDWASAGLYAEDSANVYLHDLNIHGLAHTGIRAGRLTDWTVENVRIAGNGYTGWEGDIGDSSNSGTLYFRHWTVEWNGCGETYPGEEPHDCRGQSAGGYGDGVGTGATGGNWIIEDSAFLHNTSDGLDLLYHTLGGTTVLNRIHAEGNAGNQVKVAGEVTIVNSVLVGNCAFFENQPFTYGVDHCRPSGTGTTLSLAYLGGEQVSITNTTFYGHGDGLIFAEPHEGPYQCNGSEKLIGRNNLFLGDIAYDPEHDDDGKLTYLYYQQNCNGLIFDNDYGIAFPSGIRNVGLRYITPPFPSLHNWLQEPAFIGPISGESYGLQLSAASPAIDAGDDSVCPPTDIRGYTRPVDGNADGNAGCDIGAYEFGAVGAILAEFDADPYQGFTPLAVHFTNRSIGSCTTAWWDFGDGNRSDSPWSSVWHTYESVGTYSVTLTVTGLPGQAETTQPITVFRRLYLPLLLH